MALFTSNEIARVVPCDVIIRENRLQSAAAGCFINFSEMFAKKVNTMNNKFVNKRKTPKYFPDFELAPP